MAYTRDDWNDIIQQVNNLAQNPDAGCDAIAPLDEVGPNHIWTETDIQQVRDKLTEICANNTFTVELRLWAQDVIDEINNAIAQGWCDCCEDILCEFGQIIYPGALIASIPAAISYICPGYPDPTPGCTRYPNYQLFFDWAPIINNLTIGTSGYCSRFWNVQRYNTVTHQETGSYTVFPTGSSGLILCNGNVQATMNTSGNLGMGIDDHPELWLLRLYARCATEYEGQLWQTCMDCNQYPNC